MRARSKSSKVRRKRSTHQRKLGRAQRVPVVERVAPVLAVAREEVGRHAGDDAALEELRVGAVVGAVRRDVDGHVAEDAHAALGRVRAERAPLALEAHLPGRRRPARRRRPSSPIQYGFRATNASTSSAETGASGSASSPVQPAKAEGEAYGEPVSSGGPIGSTCHHVWPAAASQSTKR